MESAKGPLLTFTSSSLDLRSVSPQKCPLRLSWLSGFWCWIVHVRSRTTNATDQWTTPNPYYVWTRISATSMTTWRHPLWVRLTTALMFCPTSCHQVMCQKFVNRDFWSTCCSVWFCFVRYVCSNTGPKCIQISQLCMLAISLCNMLWAQQTSATRPVRTSHGRARNGMTSLLDPLLFHQEFSAPIRATRPNLGSLVRTGSLVRSIGTGTG